MTLRALVHVTGIKVTRTSPRITHLIYANDLVIYCRATKAEAMEVRDCLQKYCYWIGQAINWEKSAIHFSKNVPCLLKRKLCRLMEMQECSHTGKCLGLAFCKFKSRAEAFQGVVAKMADKLAGWKQRVLSMAGRKFLIKSVVQSLPSYIMQSFRAAKYALEKIDGMMRTFFWGHDTTKNRHIHLNPGTQCVCPKSWEEWAFEV